MSDPKTPDTRATDEAIAAALDAEQRAEDAVEECREQARRELDDARERARRIRQRGERRISDVHLRCSRGTAQAIDELLRDNALRGRKQSTADIEQADVKSAVEALAAELTGESDPPGNEPR